MIPYKLKRLRKKQMLNLFIKINHFFLSENYRYFDIFLGFCGLLYCFYVFNTSGNIEYLIISFSVMGILFGVFDITRKINAYLQSKMLVMKK